MNRKELMNRCSICGDPMYLEKGDTCLSCMEAPFAIRKARMLALKKRKAKRRKAQRAKFIYLEKSK